MTNTPSVIAPFVSSETDNVYSLHGLPEEVVAVLFAYFSRSPHPLRENLRAMVAEGYVPSGGATAITAAARERARAFHEKWVVGYGHGSVAEHAVVHIALEGISLLAAKAIEDCRLGTAFTEKSTRYIPFDDDGYSRAAVPDTDPEAVAAVKGLLGAYRALVDEYTKLAPPGGDNARRAWALDRARQLLPVAAATSVGMTVNGRALRAMVRKLRTDPHAEVRELAEKLLAVGRAELPGLLGGDVPAAPSHRAAGIAEVYARLPHPVPGASVALAVGTRGLPPPGFTGGLTAGEPLPRAFEAMSVRIHLQCSYAAWRDIQRHRVFAASPVRIATRSAVELIDGGLLPPEVQHKALGAISESLRVASAREGAGVNTAEAEYVLPIGSMIRVTLTGNVRGLAHFISLRSGKQGHDSYRAVAQDLHRQLAEVYPEIAALIPCDYAPRVLSRA